MDGIYLCLPSSQKQGSISIQHKQLGTLPLRGALTPPLLCRTKSVVVVHNTYKCYKLLARFLVIYIAGRKPMLVVVDHRRALGLFTPEGLVFGGCPASRRLIRTAPFLAAQHPPGNGSIRQSAQKESQEKNHFFSLSLFFRHGICCC